MNDDWLVLGCAILAIMLALVGIVLPEQTSMLTYPYANLTGIPQSFPYGNLTSIPSEVSPYSYLIYKNGSVYSAKNGVTGVLDFSSTNCSFVTLSCVNVLPVKVGGLIMFKADKFYFDTQITLSGRYGVDIEMEVRSWRSETASLDQPNVGFYLLKDMSYLFLADNQGVGGVYSLTFKNLKLYGNYTSAGYSATAIRVRSSDRTVIENVVIKNFKVGIDGGSMGDNCLIRFVSVQAGETGIVFSGSNGVIEYPYIATMSLRGLYLGGSCNLVIHPQVFYVPISADSAINIYAGTGISIIDPIVYSNGVGINIWRVGSGNSVRGGQVYSNTYGIVVGAPNGVALTNNSVIGVHVYSNTYGISESGNLVDWNIYSSCVMGGNTYDILTVGVHSHANLMYNGSSWLS